MSEPLAGRSVVITRSAAQNANLRVLLEECGAHVVEMPLVSIEEPEDEGRERDAMLQQLHTFDWVVVTSPNGAERVAPFLSAAGAAADSPVFPRLAAVGGGATDRHVVLRRPDLARDLDAIAVIGH
ncbi:MAG: uroporphyrinogen-III synthase, partial [Acidimicrobiales bacterium]